MFTVRTTNLPRALTALIGAIGLLTVGFNPPPSIFTGAGVTLLAMALLASFVFPKSTAFTPEICAKCGHRHGDAL